MMGTGIEFGRPHQWIIEAVTIKINRGLNQGWFVEYRVELAVTTGPLDLLLYLLKRG